MSSQLNTGKTDSKSIKPSNEFKEKIAQIFKLNNEKLDTEKKQEISLEELIDQIEQILKEANLSLDDVNKIVINKTDLPRELKEEEVKKYFSEHSLLWISVKDEHGLDDLKKVLDDLNINSIAIPPLGSGQGGA